MSEVVGVGMGDVNVAGLTVVGLHPGRELAALPFRDKAVDQQGAAIVTERRRGIRDLAAATGEEKEIMASERVLDVTVYRHVFETDRPFARVLDGIFGGISQPDIAQLFSELAASGTYQEFSSLVEQAQGRAGLMRFLQLDLDGALSLDPEAKDWTGRRLVRLIAGNPVTMGEMTRHVPDAGSYAPVTILIEETPGGGTRVAYDSVVSAIARYDDAAASEVAERLDAEVLGLLRAAT
jgi:hypothetical protein